MRTATRSSPPTAPQLHPPLPAVSIDRSPVRLGSARPSPAVVTSQLVIAPMRKTSETLLRSAHLAPPTLLESLFSLLWFKSGPLYLPQFGIFLFLQSVQSRFVIEWDVGVAELDAVAI